MKMIPDRERWLTVTGILKSRLLKAELGHGDIAIKIAWEVKNCPVSGPIGNYDWYSYTAVALL